MWGGGHPIPSLLWRIWRLALDRCLWQLTCPPLPVPPALTPLRNPTYMYVPGHISSISIYWFVFFMCLALSRCRHAEFLWAHVAGESTLLTFYGVNLHSFAIFKMVHHFKTLKLWNDITINCLHFEDYIQVNRDTCNKMTEK